MSDQTKERCPTCENEDRANRSGNLVDSGRPFRCVDRWHDVSPVIATITEWDMDIPRNNKLESWPIDKLPTPKVAPVAPAVAKELAMAIVADYGRATVGDSLAGYHAHKIAESIEEYAASLSTHPHHLCCNYQTGPIGGYGCICVVTYKKHLEELQAELERVTRERDEMKSRRQDIGFNCTICGGYIVGRYHMYAEAGTYAHEDCHQAKRAEAAERSLETAREALKGIRNLADPKTSILRIPDNALKQIQLIAESVLSGESALEGER